jgi:hypothetical protein
MAVQFRQPQEGGRMHPDQPIQRHPRPREVVGCAGIGPDRRERNGQNLLPIRVIHRVIPRPAEIRDDRRDANRVIAMRLPRRPRRELHDTRALLQSLVGTLLDKQSFRHRVSPSVRVGGLTGPGPSNFVAMA